MKTNKYLINILIIQLLYVDRRLTCSISWDVKAYTRKERRYSTTSACPPRTDR